MKSRSVLARSWHLLLARSLAPLHRRTEYPRWESTSLALAGMTTQDWWVAWTVTARDMRSWLREELRRIGGWGLPGWEEEVAVAVAVWGSVAL